MREILFRGKRTDNGKWVEGDLIHLPSGIAILANGYAYIDPETVGQYIGLEDDNGDKIFEGDIVRLTYENLLLQETHEWKGRIEFGNPNGEHDWGWQIVPIENCKYNPAILLWIETQEPTMDCKIIGNIDNPELLEVK